MADFKHIVLGLNPIQYGGVIHWTNSEFFFASTGQRIDAVFQCEETAVIEKVGFAVRDHAGGNRLADPPTEPPKFRVSIQTVTNGIPDGGLVGTGIFQAPANDDDPATWWQNVFRWIDITPASLVRGSFYATVIEFWSGVLNNQNYITFNPTIEGSSPKVGLPFVATVNPTGGRTLAGKPIYGLQSDTGKKYGIPVSNYDKTEFTYGSPVERALAFRLPGEMGNLLKVAGVYWWGLWPAIGRNFKVQIYDGTDVIGNTTVQGGWKAGFGAFPGERTATILFDENTLSQLIFDRTYYIAITPTSPADAMQFSYLTFDQASDHDALPGGEYFFYAERTGTGDWTEHTNIRPLANIITSEWGAEARQLEGVHLKFTPKWNDNIFVQHADDKVVNTDATNLEGGEPHESGGIPIGEAIECYSGYLTVEVFRDPDTDRSPDFILFPETPIEQIKLIKWDPWVDGTFEIVFRLRAVAGSEFFEEVVRYVRVIT
jgi:hypothetical protein